MNKREKMRHNINTSIVCSYVGSTTFSETFDGQMKNCSAGGMYAELCAQFKAGTILSIRTTGQSFGLSQDEGFRLQALAEVKWSNLKSMQRDVCYGTGLRYLML